MDRVEHLVIGAGVSGLAYADWLDSTDYLVVEADDEIGGFCKTVRQDGFVWDYSGHFFHFRHKEIEAYLLERMKEQRVLEVEKKSDIYWPGGNVDFPFQRNIHQLPKDDFLECLHDLYFARESGPREPSNFLEMLFAKFGEGIAQRFLIPYNEKLYATDLGKLDVDAMGRFFPYADVADVIRQFKQANNTSYNASFTYPEGGAIQYVQALMHGVEADKVCLGERVEAIDLERKTATTTKREIEFSHLVTSAPFPRLLSMLGESWDDEVFDWNVVEVFNLGFDRKGPEGVHWRYFPQRDVSFYRVGFYDNIFGTDRMSIYLELGRPRGYVTNEEERAKTLAMVLEDLRGVGIVDGHELVSSHHVLLDPAYVHITAQSVSQVAERKAGLSAQGVHSIGRYGSWTYCSIEDNIVEARALAESMR